MRLTHPLVHRLRRLFRLPDHHTLYENAEGMMEAGCGLCQEFLAELLIEEPESPTTRT